MQRQYRGSNLLKMNGRDIKLDYYLIKEEKVFFDDITPRNTYGIEIVEDDIESELISDISVNKEIITNIIEMLKINKVLPVHLQDVIEDLL